jgi:hypothetical protein
MTQRETTIKSWNTDYIIQWLDGLRSDGVRIDTVEQVKDVLKGKKIDGEELFNLIQPPRVVAKSEEGLDERLLRKAMIKNNIPIDVVEKVIQYIINKTARFYYYGEE